METNKLGNQAVLIASILGGNLVGTIASSKINFLQEKFGRLLLIVVGIILSVKTKSDILRGASIGIALTGGSGFVQELAKGVSGIDGLLGIEGDYGVGDIIQGPDGMMYMVNGLGELEPIEDEVYLDDYYDDDDDVIYVDDLEGDDDLYALSGADDDVIAVA